jgi:hypothetical protein
LQLSIEGCNYKIKENEVRQINEKIVDKYAEDIRRGNWSMDRVTGDHWLLSTSDREHGGKLVLGIFDSEDAAWQHYRNTHDENEGYWRIPFVECWCGCDRMQPPPDKNT